MAANRLKQAIAALAIGGATVALGGVAAHGASAQQTLSTTSIATTTTATTSATTRTTNATTAAGTNAQDPREQYLAAVAKKLNVTTDQLKQAMDQARQELGLPDRPGGPGGPGHGGPGLGFDAAAKAIGISTDQLRQELPGRSLTDVAKAHNVDPSVVAEALKAAAAAHLDQDVGEGRITADQAAQMKQGLSDRINQMMTRQVPADAPMRGERGQPPTDGSVRGGPGQAPANAPFPGGPRI